MFYIGIRGKAEVKHKDFSLVAGYQCQFISTKRGKGWSVIPISKSSRNKNVPSFCETFQKIPLSTQSSVTASKIKLLCFE
jgi:hypothetical protein